MNRIIASLKNIRLDRILTVFLAGILLFVSTACNGSVSAKTADKVREEVPGSAVTSPYEGGMNDYSDVDPRANTSATKAKAKGLVDNAQSNLEKRADDAEQYVENYRGGAPLPERVQRIGENVGEAAANVRDDIVKGTKENTQNIQKTASKSSDAAQDASENVKSKVSKDVNRAQRAVDKAADAIDD